MIQDMEVMTQRDIPATQDSDPLDLAPLEHTMPRGDNESSDEYCEETDTYHPLTELLEQSCYLKKSVCKFEIYHPLSYTYSRADTAHR